MFYHFNAILDDWIRNFLKWVQFHFFLSVLLQELLKFQKTSEVIEF